MRSILPLLFLGVLMGACLVGAADKLPAFTVERWVNSVPLTAEALRPLAGGSGRLGTLIVRRLPIGLSNSGRWFEKHAFA